MVMVHFTQNLQRYVSCPPQSVKATTLRETLQAVFFETPELEPYIVDEHGALRRHINVFVNGSKVQDRIHLSDEVDDGGKVYVMQALSGG